MSTRAAAAADLRSRIAGNLTASANGEGPEPPRSVVAGVSALPTAPGPESGVMTSAVAAAASTEAVDTEAAPAAPPPAPVSPIEPVASAPPPAPVALPAPVSVAPVPSVPAAATVKGWDKLSITLSQSDFNILETQTGQARAAGIKMRRGGNPSVFLRAALRNLESLRLTNKAAWLELVRGVASTENSQ